MVGDYEIQHHASMYLRYIDNFASKILQHIASTRDGCGELAIFCIGDTYDIDQANLHGDESIKIHQSLCYLTGTQRDYFGKETIAAIPIALQEVHDLAPEYCGVKGFGHGMPHSDFDCFEEV